MRLTLVTNRCSIPLDSYVEFVSRCARAGITSLQLREKTLPTKELAHFGMSLKKVLDPLGIPLIVNDHLELCLKLDAAGVHLGQSDGDPIRARELLGTDKVIGLSVNSVDQIKEANRLPLDYIGIGAIFPTNNKPNIETLWGLSGLKEASSLSVHPIVAIGGIDESNAASVIEAGAWGIAAIGVFHEARDPYGTTKNLANSIWKRSNDRKN